MFLTSFNGIRQYLCVSYLFFLWMTKRENKVLWLFSILIHKSAIIALPLFFLLSRKISVAMWVISLCVLILMEYLFLESYKDITIYFSRNVVKSDMTMVYLNIIVGVIGLVFFKNSRNIQGIFSVNLLVLLFALSSSISTQFLLRITQYFTIFYPIAIIKLMDGGNRQAKLLPIIMVLVTLYFVRNVYLNGFNTNLLPYESIFSIHS